MTEKPIKEALNRMAYGFYAITTRDGEEVNAMVANWVTQASFTPRLITMGIQKTCYSRGLMESGKVLAVNIFLKEDQEAITPFAKGRSKNPDKMKDAQYEPGPETGCPILEDAAAYVECRVVQIMDIGGDHDLVVGEVVGAGVLKPGEVGDSLTLPDLGWSYAG